MTFLAAALAQLPVALIGLNLEQFLLDTGPWVLVVSAIIVFIGSGVLFPVLPGDSLIFALGMLHQQMGLSLWVAFPVLVIVAMAGAEVGYQIGARYGRNIFKDDAKILSSAVAWPWFWAVSCRLCVPSFRWQPGSLRTTVRSSTCGTPSAPLRGLV